MGFFKGVLFGIAACATVQYLTKKDELTGRSIVDDLMERAPAALDQVKVYTTQIKEEFLAPEPPPEDYLAR